MGSDPKIRRILCQRLLQLRHENNLTQAELSSLSQGLRMNLFVN